MSGAGTSGPSILILLGSARSDGDTANAAHALAASLGVDATLVDLLALRILMFDYSSPSQDDDFDTLVDLMLAHRSVVFATPVYWYSMSSIMKTCFDRLSDLLSGRDSQSRGRRLGGRDMSLLAVGSDPALPPGFDQPFASTAAYLGMNWRGAFYVCSGKQPDRRQLDALADLLRPAASATRR